MQSYVVNSCTSLRLSKFKAKSTSSPMSTSATATATSTSNTNSCSSSNTNSQNHNRNLASVILNSLLNDYSGGSMTLKFCNNNNNNSVQAIYWVILILILILMLPYHERFPLVVTKRQLLFLSSISRNVCKIQRTNVN